MSVGFHDHFSKVAQGYADFRPHYPAELFDYLATLTPRDCAVWDCASGSGQATIDLAERFDKVIATDGSAEQIASAPRRHNIEYRVALAEQSGLPEESVSLITVAQALHWFNQERFFAEVKRVLKPGGALATWIYAKTRMDGDEIDSIVEDYYSNVVGPFWPPERRMVEEGYSTLVFPFPAITTPSFRMEARWTLDQLLGYFSTWSATNRFIKANGRNPIGPLKEALGKVWGEPESAPAGRLAADVVGWAQGMKNDEIVSALWSFRPVYGDCKFADDTHMKRSAHDPLVERKSHRVRETIGRFARQKSMNEHPRSKRLHGARANRARKTTRTEGRKQLSVRRVSPRPTTLL